MYIHGYYYNQHDEKVTVHILTDSDRTTELEIGSEEDGIYFGEDPVEITSQMSDTFDTLLMYQASVRLLCRNYVPQFYGSSCRHAVVNIYRGEECVFAGYIEPQAYSQPYNEALDEVELTCVDALGSLTYARYRNVGALGVSYSALRRDAQQRTLLDIITQITTDATEGLDIVGGKAVPLLYDGSKAIDDTEAHRYSVLADVSLSELLFLGDEEDDTWTQEDVVSEVARYLDLHMVQQGLRLYLFDWASLRTGKPIAFCNLSTQEITTVTPTTIDITTRIVADADTQITIGNTYNQLLLTDSVTEVDDLMDDPLDTDKLESLYGRRQMYLTEYSADGEGKRAYTGIADMVMGRQVTYDCAKVTDWFVQAKRHPDWVMYCAGKTIDSLAQTKTQTELIDSLGQGVGTAMLVSVGKVQKDGKGKDNSPVSHVSMTDYLVITTNGNGKDTEAACRPSEADIKAAIPCAEYVGAKAGGTLSPADPMVTNYIVISGKMILNPLMPMTDYYTNMRRLVDTHDRNGHGHYWHQTVDSRNNSDGRYYTRRHWRPNAQTGKEEDNPTPDAEQNPAFIPYTEEGPQLYEYQYSAYGDETDRLSKVPVVACMLIVGDKCVVEKAPGQTLGTSTPGTGNGQKQDYVWQPYKSREQCQSDEEYYAQSFTVGIDPKIGDKLVGTEFDIQNNVSYKDGIDADGTAIPIAYADKVAGQVRLVILGPVNTTWEQITRHHPSFWKHTKWSTASVPLLAHTSSVMIGQLQIKVVSDNGKSEVPSGQNDIVYMSDTKEGYVNRKDDIEMKITTALTADECRQMGVGSSVWLSSPLRTDTQTPLTTLYNHATGQQAKPEQHYVDAYWREWHEPRIEMEQNLIEQPDCPPVTLFTRYRHPTLGKTFHVEGIDRNLTDGTAKATLKEIF